MTIARNAGMFADMGRRPHAVSSKPRDVVQSLRRSIAVDEHVSASGVLVREHPSNADALIATMAGITRDVSSQYNGAPVIRYIGSDASEDRHVSVLDQGSAVVTKFYESNPVFVWCHQYGIPIIGSCLALDVQDKRTVFDIEFAVDEWDMPNTANLAKLVYRLAAKGRMPASSVGFIPIKFEEYEAKDPESVPWYVQPVRFTKWELLELSSVPIPSNRNALKKALADGDVSETEIDFLGLKRFMLDDRPYVLSLPRAHVDHDVAQQVARKGLIVLGGRQPADDTDDPTDPQGAFDALTASARQLFDAWNASDKADDDKATTVTAFNEATDSIEQAIADLTADEGEDAKSVRAAAFCTCCAKANSTCGCKTLGTDSCSCHADCAKCEGMKCDGKATPKSLTSIIARMHRELDDDTIATLIETEGGFVAATKFLDAWRAMTAEQRIGAVLSRKNKNALQNAVDLIDGVLADADKSEEPTTDETEAAADVTHGTVLDNETVRGLVALQDQISRIIDDARAVHAASVTNEDRAGSGDEAAALTQQLSDLQSVAANLIS